MNRKLVVMSADGLVVEDVRAMASMPGFQKYFSHCARAESVRSIYPTITYPCHMTMITGVYPDKHGIYGNYEFIPGRKKLPWKWFYSANRWPDDIFKAAKREGLTTAAVFWPVTGNHPAIDWLIDEYWPQSPEDSLEDTFRRSGSSDELVDLVLKYSPGVKFPKHPDIDGFMLNCTCDIIRKHQPDLMLVHPADVDGFRHKNGVFNDEVMKAVRNTDRYLMQIMETLEETGLIDCTDVVLTSDHGLIDVTQTLHPNILLEQHGLLKTDGEGKLLSWEAYCLAQGTSALIYLNPEAGPGVWERTYQALQVLKDEGIWGIGDVFTQEEAQQQEHYGGDFAFVLETDGKTAFGDHLEGDALTFFKTKTYPGGQATHGHLPDKGPQPVFLGVGPHFKPDAVVPRIRLIDEAPTYAKILGLHLQGADGVPVDGMLNF